MKHSVFMIAASFAALTIWACATGARTPAWEQANPIEPLPEPPLGLDQKFTDLARENQPTPERVRLGRWLFYDTRLSVDNTVSCASCHHPQHGFSEQTPHSTGIKGQEGTRKAPSFLNQAWTLYPNFFWDGRAQSLEEQALGPVANPIEMGSTHDAMLQTLDGIPGYRRYFKEAFGTEEITKDRVAKAIADYERTCMSGDSAWDRWKKNRDESAVSDEVKLGDAVFFGKGACNQCHLGQSLTDSSFHNVGVGYNAESGTFADEGRYVVTKKPEDRGAFKTPGLRDVALRAPYMHDGSVPTLRAVVEHYNQGGIANPALDPKMKKLNLSEAEITALVKFMEALNGNNPRETAPTAFPQ
ncbi:MAG: cytochrome-c peroxidase [Betaproteobacteria bacterium]